MSIDRPVPGSIALMQPYFFPYLGYFSLIAAAERFYTFDSAQYIRRGWVHRNRLRHPTAGWRHITLPIEKAPRDSPCDAVRLRETPGWRDGLLALLAPYQAAPHYARVRALVAEALAPRDADVASLCRHALRATCGLLGIATPIASSRELDLGGPVDHPGDWGWRAATAAGATVYLNAPGGRALYAPSVYRAQGLRLGFVDPVLAPYEQGGRDFENGLSIIDVLMWLGPEGAAERVRAAAIDWP